MSVRASLLALVASLAVGGCASDAGTGPAPGGTSGTVDTGGMTDDSSVTTGGAENTSATATTGGMTTTDATTSTGTGSSGVVTTGGVTTAGMTTSGGETGSGGSETGSGGTSSGESGGGGTTATGGVAPACSEGSAQPGDVTVDMSGLQQKISGFGVSTAWAGDFRDPENDPDTLWSTETGAGLTLHRIRIGGGTTSETKIAKKAVEYGVKVWATPWEVNSADTDRANCPGNGACDPPPKLVDPADWANRLVDFVNTMKDEGVPIYAISAENEPDSGGMNATTSFTATELAEWIGSHLGPALANTDTRVMGPETMNWWGFPEYFEAIQNNTEAWKHVSIFASHEYGLGPSQPEPSITDAGKEYWETEVDTGTTSDDPTGDNMPSALKLAETIHNDLTKANLNAWHYWWLYAGGSSGLFDTNTNVWTKRFWIMGNFSRFVRPGYMRVSTSGEPPTGVLLSAYTNPSDGTLVVVAINKNSNATDLSVHLSEGAACEVTPWVTSESDSIAASTAIVVTDARFSVTLAAKSVTTFVGKP